MTFYLDLLLTFLLKRQAEIDLVARLALVAAGAMPAEFGGHFRPLVRYFYQAPKGQVSLHACMHLLYPSICPPPQTDKTAADSARQGAPSTEGRHAIQGEGQPGEGHLGNDIVHSAPHAKQASDGLSEQRGDRLRIRSGSIPDLTQTASVVGGVGCSSGAAAAGEVAAASGITANGPVKVRLGSKCPC